MGIGLRDVREVYDKKKDAHVHRGRHFFDRQIGRVVASLD